MCCRENENHRIIWKEYVEVSCEGWKMDIAEDLAMDAAHSAHTNSSSKKNRATLHFIVPLRFLCFNCVRHLNWNDSYVTQRKASHKPIPPPHPLSLAPFEKRDGNFLFFLVCFFLGVCVEGWYACITNVYTNWISSPASSDFSCRFLSSSSSSSYSSFLSFLLDNLLAT